MAVINNMNHLKMKVFWGRLVELLENQTARTSLFLDIKGAVWMIDWRKND